MVSNGLPSGGVWQFQCTEHAAKGWAGVLVVTLKCKHTYPYQPALNQGQNAQLPGKDITVIMEMGSSRGTYCSTVGCKQPRPLAGR